MPSIKEPTVENIRANLSRTIAALYVAMRGASSVTKEDELGAFYEASSELLVIATMVQDAVNKAELGVAILPDKEELRLDLDSLDSVRCDKAPVTLRVSTPEPGSTPGGGNLDILMAHTMNVAELLNLGKDQLHALYKAHLAELELSHNEVTAALMVWEELTEMEQAAMLWSHYNPQIPMAAHG